MRENVTRGYGALEGFLAKKRAQLANKLISDQLRNGRILDIGCGFYPYFLSSINFKEKFGLNKNFSNKINSNDSNINLIQHNLEKNSTLPFTDNYFNVVTGLAVLEHLYAEDAIKILREIHRTLKPYGFLIITVPRKELNLPLKLMSKIKLVSAIEVDEHKQLYDNYMLNEQFLSAGFNQRNIKIGSFEFGLNLFALCEK